MTREYHYVADTAGMRLDRFVGEKCPELSRTHARNLIIDGLITVNGQVTKVGHKLDAGDNIAVVIPPEPPARLLPEEIPLNILYEDNDVL
ncbi:MAG: S4 domain-containing protein, partial [Dehalococcoidia bacterium]